jgi:hydrogenase maturation protease
MSRGSGPVVAIGIGSILHRDDGLGPRVIAELRTRAAADPRALPANVRLVDGGTTGAAVLDQLVDARALLLIDAVDIGLVPGAVTTIPGDRIARRAGGGVESLIGVARLAGRLPDAVAMVGVQAVDLGPGATPTPEVEAAIAIATDAACRALRALDERTASGTVPVGRPFPSHAEAVA